MTQVFDTSAYKLSQWFFANIGSECIESRMACQQQKGLIPTVDYEGIQAVEECRIAHKTFVEVQCKLLDRCSDLCEKKRTIAVAERQDLKYA
jgi:galactokinase